MTRYNEYKNSGVQWLGENELNVSGFFRFQSGAAILSHPMN